MTAKTNDCGESTSGSLSSSNQEECFGQIRRSRSNHRAHFDGRYRSHRISGPHSDCDRPSKSRSRSISKSRSRSRSKERRFQHKRKNRGRRSSTSSETTFRFNHQKRDTHSVTVRSTYSKNRAHHRAKRRDQSNHYDKGSESSKHKERHSRHKHARIRHHDSTSRGRHNESHSRSRSTSYSGKDGDGYMILEPGVRIRRRYIVDRVLGEGTFGRVACCIDKKKRSSDGGDRFLAIKVIKAVQRYRDAAQIEIRVLDKLAREDPSCHHRCIPILDWFDYHGHICLVFELMGKSLYDFLKSNSYEPYPIEQVRHITYQLCDAVKFIHDCGLIHTDLKPENVLFLDSSYYTVMKKDRPIRILKNTEIRVIDFGSAVSEKDHHSTTVATRHYRAPEIVLEMGWSYPCDVWAVGCILYEIYKGQTLFMTHDNLEHLAMMERVLGKMPDSMIANSRRRRFFRHGKLDFDWHRSSGRYVRKHLKKLELCKQHDTPEDEYCIDLIRQMLHYVDKQRCTMTSALNHRFFHSREDCRGSLDSALTSGHSRSRSSSYSSSS